MHISFMTIIMKTCSLLLAMYSIVCECSVEMKHYYTIYILYIASLHMWGACGVHVVVITLSERLLNVR